MQSFEVEISLSIQLEMMGRARHISLKYQLKKRSRKNKTSMKADTEMMQPILRKQKKITFAVTVNSRKFIS